MKEQSLALSFSNSLTIDVASIASEYAELGLDALVEEGILKDIPLVSTAVAVYRIGKSIHERHHVAKLTSFLAGINEGIVDEEQRQKYRQTFSGNEKFRNQELEYILILIDRYIGFDKPQMLAKLYLAYLDDEICWTEFTKYSEVVDRFLPGDYLFLINITAEKFVASCDFVDSILRLMSMGLVAQNVGIDVLDDGNGNVEMKNAEGYSMTTFGIKLNNIFKR